MITGGSRPRTPAGAWPAAGRAVERPDVPDRLVGDGSEQGREGRAVGQGQVRIELEQRLEDEAAGGHLGVRQGQPVGPVDDVSEEQDIDVDRPRAMTWAARDATEGPLDVLAGVEQPLGAELGLDRHAGVEEVRLVQQLALRRGLMDRRRRDDGDAAPLEL